MQFHITPGILWMLSEDEHFFACNILKLCSTNSQFYSENFKNVSEKHAIINLKKQNQKERLNLVSKILFPEMSDNEIVIEQIVVDKKTSNKSYFYIKTVKKIKDGTAAKMETKSGFFLMNDGCFYYGTTVTDNVSNVSLFFAEYPYGVGHEPICMSDDDFDVFC